ncbi:FAD-dependent oxidoreductase [Pseudoponticoccus marisrubri]|uniref:D-amino-acid oxidase n=1 Tax=Pseudoponticoccus marisrubri TaxID=1685382 RepID=A0A0W7WH74_9RHOB|nr:FAD-dependent oxidoreductase [Pseudoponticoccus marisrubri]KUF09887.1 thiamine biosynthesis protein thio [Pseudoponticoccus marisrubri]
MRVLVRGSGVAGLCVAAELSARGHAVTITDPAGGPGAQACSWWAGGMLAPDCEGVTAEEPVVRLGRQAADWWQAQGAAVTRAGTLVVALGRDRRELDLFARRSTNHRWLDRDGIAAAEPQLAGRFERALMMSEEAHLDPRATLHGLRDRLVARGVRLVTDGASDTLAEQVIDCTGLAARPALPELRGVKGEMAVLRAPEIDLTRPVRLLHPRYPLYIVPRGDGRFMLGATQIESGARAGASVRSVMELLSAAYALDPAFGAAELVEIGVDARPAFPDNLPRLTRAGDTLYVNGLFRHGFLLAPALAQMAAAALEGQPDPEMLHDHHA